MKKAMFYFNLTLCFVISNPLKQTEINVLTHDDITSCLPAAAAAAGAASSSPRNQNLQQRVSLVQQPAALWLQGTSWLPVLLSGTDCRPKPSGSTCAATTSSPGTTASCRCSTGRRWRSAYRNPNHF